jgi:hypothetical protein
MLEYLIEFNQVNPRNFSEESLDRDPYSLMWTIELEKFSKTIYTLMRSNVMNLLTEHSNYHAKQLIVENEEPTVLSEQELIETGC